MMITLFLIVTLTFFLMKVLPGDPFSDEKALPPEIYENLRSHYGLNDPWYVQYGQYLISIAKWDLGPSIKHKGRTVNEIISEGFSVSAILGLEAFALAVFAGVFLGTLAAIKHHTWIDAATLAGVTLGISIPSFIMATLLQYLLAQKLGLFPIARWGTLWQSILPAVSLALMPAAFITRLTRSNMIEVFQQDYIKTAKAKGLSMPAILYRHTFRNALSPLLPYFAQLAANILTGSFIIEKIFAIPGLGYWFVAGVANRDYTVIMGVTVFYSMILLIMLFMADFFYSMMDPRIRKS
jgi:oligopeptide transport system permease protein